MVIKQMKLIDPYYVLMDKDGMNYNIKFLIE